MTAIIIRQMKLDIKEIEYLDASKHEVIKTNVSSWLDFVRSLDRDVTSSYSAIEITLLQSNRKKRELCAKWFCYYILRFSLLKL